MENLIYSINGPVVKVKNTKAFSMLEKVYVGSKKLMGEVISISNDETVIQVYESTAGLKLNDPVYPSKELVSVDLGPGLLTNIFDGIQRPLTTIKAAQGAFMKEGGDTFALDLKKKWPVTFLVKKGDHVKPGMIYATTPETDLITHRFLVPQDVEGVITNDVKSGDFTLDTISLEVKTNHGSKQLNFMQRWPIKKARPILERLPLSMPLITGQRIIDTLFPIAKGGTAAIPGGFGTGKTMMQHQFAKWCDADVIVYIGCGERGNEMTQVLEEFRELIDPKSGKSLMERTLLIANTSNMPVAAREASIYTGLTIAEYYRDMGYHVAIMADSTSRWAEALREISGRLEEMPAEEGFPAYLPSRISQFYERAGLVKNLNESEGSISIIGAVSPQGSDFSEPVTQNTKRFVRAFWALDKNLAYARHYAAVNWNQSYSKYLYDLESWYNESLGYEFLTFRKRIMYLLAEENKLLEVVNLVGADVLPDHQRLIIEIGRVIREGFLQQNAFHKEDTFVPLEKQLKMMDIILYLYDETLAFIKKDKALSLVLATHIFDDVIKIKYDIDNRSLDKFDAYKKRIQNLLETIK